ncbi:MAG TPA: NADH-quinone oxidoreductase subunit NuoF [Planctomycetota bacterium]|nr:NADH-quinone oxidoreductase subunit NuoF [Planctomycetota bacterium]
MKKIKTPAELKSLRKSIVDKTDSSKTGILICKSTGCSAFGADSIVEGFKNEIRKKGLVEKVEVKITGCHGFCERGPILVIQPKGIFYQRCKPEDIAEIVSKTLIKGEVIERLLYVDPVTGKRIIYEKDVPFYNRQKRLVFEHSGKIDPTNIEDYMAVGGYSALAKVLSGMKPEQVIDEVKKAGLRGRGGAGFPTGIKWETARKQPDETKYIVCNADEGDPGAYMDRSIMESNPHSVIEGMIIGAYAIGATEGWMYVRNEYPLAVTYTTKAIEQAKDMGFLGHDIFGSGFSFDIKIAKGAGAFVCGEETSLIASIEGKRGMPKQRPPFPAQKGLFGKPTNINNVETWATVPIIIEKGSQWYADIGTKTSKGTKIFSLVGKVQNTGLVEVPMGTTLNEVVFDIGGGAPKGKKVKAVQTGGPSGGCIPRNLFNLPVDYESLTQAGAIMGSGGMIVMDENTCMVDIARYFTNFLQNESCGKCVTCREGTQRMYEILTDITEGNGKEENIGLLKELGLVVKDASMCGLGQTAANPVLATLRYFQNEYDEHIKYKKCSAATCKEIISSPCQHTCPIDTEAQLYISLIAAGRFKDAVDVIKKDNPISATLARVCNHPCEGKCRAGDSAEPIGIRDLKRFATDYGLKNKLHLKVKASAKNNLGKVAIVGSGPAGLTCGFYLSLKGYQVTIFEKSDVVGGMLALAIPSYRLPRNILAADIEYIKSSGVEIKTNTQIGKDISIDDLLKQGYKAVFIATGTHKSARLDLNGEEAEGVLPAMKVLHHINTGKKINIGKKVGVIGGGNSAVDAARVALRSGTAEEVTIFYRRTISEMPAFKEEIKAALEEGVKIELLTAPVKLLTGNSKLSGCEFIRMELGEMDASGRRKPVPVKNSEFTVKLDTLVVAVGEQADSSVAGKTAGVEVSKSGTIIANPETLQTNHKRVFAGGDIVTGPSTVVEAVAAGKIAAQSINQLLKDQDIKREYKVTRPSAYLEPTVLTEADLADVQRPQPAELPVNKRKDNFNEVEQVLSEVMAIKEARRCLRCDLETKDGKKFMDDMKQSKKEKGEVVCQK